MKWHKRSEKRMLERNRPLTLEQRGALATIEDLVMMRNGPVPPDARWLAGHLNISVRRWGVLLKELLTLGVLVESDDGYMTAEYADVLAERRKSSDQGAAAGQASGEARRANGKLSQDNSGIISGSEPSASTKSNTCGNGRWEEQEGDRKPAAAVRLPAAAPSRSKPQDPALTQQAVELHREVAHLIGSEAGQWAHEFGTVMGWVERGWARHVVPAIERVLKRRKGQLPNSWRYFTDAVGELAKAAGPVASATASAAPIAGEMSEADWERAVVAYCRFAEAAKRKGLAEVPRFAWSDRLGAAPGEDGCVVPKAVLERHGFTKAA